MGASEGSANKVNAVKTKNLFGKIKPLWLVVVLVLILGAVLIVWLTNKQAVSTNGTNSQEVQTNNYINTVNKDIANKKYQQAITLINSQKDKSSTDNQVLLASVYAAEGNPTAALQIYANINKSGQMTYATAATAANIALNAQQFSTAITYYNLAIKLAPGHDPTATSDIQYFKGQVAALKKQEGQ